MRTLKTKDFFISILLKGMLTIVISFSAFAQDDLNQKLMMGYQGWFLCEGDGAAPNEWRHWYNSTTTPTAENLNVDMWPDMSEYTQTYPTDMTYQNGSTAELFSSHDASTVQTHFKWMKDYNIHGVYLQRFLGEIADPRFFDVRNNVLQNVMSAAQTHDRHFAMMYDLSGVPDDGNMYNKLISDWEYLVDNYDMTNHQGYVHQNGLPVVAIWGIGFSGRGLNPATFEQIIDYFQNSAPPQYRAYVMGGVPSQWRTLSGDSESDPQWANIYHSLDMLSPWTVGRYGDNNGADNWKNTRIVPDLADCNNNGVDYMPVIFPGFSWNNMHDGNPANPLNQIPRNNGEFYWRQAYNAVDAGAEFIYVAMFDEVDEATAMFKLAETQQDVPNPGNFVTLDIDGASLPSDWYLQLADETQKMLDNSAPVTPTIPIDPDDPEEPVTGMPNNPFITHMYTADPSAHVWDDGRLYVYPSHDIAPPQGADKMDRYHVFSTTDMVNWVDHGEILSSDDVSWGRPEGGFMWAPDCAYRNGTYYYYFPHPSGTEWNSTWKIGVATSDKPASDFTVQGYIPGLESLIDPCVFTDDDGEVYFYYGGGGVCKGGKLKDNMMEIDGQMQDMQGLVDFHEASWVHKRNGIYYLSYSDNHDEGDKHNRMRYATSTSPLGPWTYQGIYMEPTDSYTNHGSIVEYKGQWYAFYHNSALSGHDWLRSICVDKLYYNADGTIQKVTQTKGHGTPYGGTAWSVPGLIEAEDFDVGGQAISYSDSDTINHGGQYRPNEFVDIGALGNGEYNVGWLSGSEWLEYTVNVTTAGTYTMEFRVATETEGGSSIRAEFDGQDKTGSVAIPNTGGWATYTTVSKEVTLSSGEQIMTLRMGGGAFNIDYVTLTGPQGEPAPVITSSNTADGTVGTSFSYTITANNNPTSYGATNLPAGLSVNTATGEINGTPAGAGTFNATISATNAGGTGEQQLTITISPAATQSPYGGTAWSLPGVVEAENFDNGGPGLAYNDNDADNNGGQHRPNEQVDVENCSEGGFNVGWTNPGEWLEYTVNVTESTNYLLNLRVASPNGSSVYVAFAGENKTGVLTIPATGGWQTWQTISQQVSLNAGEQVMRVYMEGGAFNINFVEVAALSNEAPVADAGSDQVLAQGTTSVNLNGTASDPDNDPLTYNWSQVSGPSVTINGGNTLTPNVTGLANGNTYVFRLTVSDGDLTVDDDVQISVNQGVVGVPVPATIQAEDWTDMYGMQTENTADAGGGLNVGWIDTGDWLEYLIDVPSSGLYTINYRVASDVSGGNIDFIVNGNTLSSTGFAATGGWQTWTTVSTTVNLAAGTQTVRLYAASGGWNINWWSVATGGCTPTAITPYVAINGGTFQQTAMATLDAGGSVVLGPQPATGGSWSWSGPNGFSGTSREVTINGIQTNQAGNYVATYTNSGGCESQQTFSITVNSNPVTTTYRIRNRWQGTFLYDDGDRVRYGSTPSGSTYEWVLEDVGEGYQEIRNLGTGEYMHIENLTGYVQATSRTFGWYSSRWAFEDAGSGFVRIRNAWQSNNYIHVENLQKQAQHGTINPAWWSAQWAFEPVSSAKGTLAVSEQSTEDNALLVYPNPTKGGAITVVYDGVLMPSARLSVSDLTGTVIYEQALDNNKTVINAAWSSGIYIIKIQSGANLSVRKLIIE